MRINWNEINRDRMRALAQEEATKITADALQRLETKITAMWTAENDRVRAGMMYGLLGALREVIQETTGLAPDQPRPEPQKPRDRSQSAWGPEMDYPYAHCGESACTARHSPFGGHI